MRQTNIDAMIDWVKKAISVLPIDYGNLILYDTLRGLRPTESIESMQLLKKEYNNYLNNRTMFIEHCPNQFYLLLSIRCIFH